MRSPSEIEQTVVAVFQGAPVTIANIGKVVPGERPIYNIVTADGRPAVLINVLQQPDGNALQVARGSERTHREHRAHPSGGHRLGDVLRPIDPGSRFDPGRARCDSDRPLAQRRRPDGIPQGLADHVRRCCSHSSIPADRCCVHALVRAELQSDDPRRDGSLRGYRDRRCHRDGREHQRSHGNGAVALGSCAQRYHRADAGVDRFDAHSHHGFRASGLPRGDYGGVLSFAGGHDGHGPPSLTVPGDLPDACPVGPYPSRAARASRNIGGS